jgi:hypothetical protein
VIEAHAIGAGMNALQSIRTKKPKHEGPKHGGPKEKSHCHGKEAAGRH